MTSRRKCFSLKQWHMIVCAGVACLLIGGCVHRQLVIQSSPPGAIVQVNGKTVGATPVDYPFTHYGTHHITLLKDGYETEVIKQPVNSPWYEYFPLDFISEQLVPFMIRDIRRHTYPLKPLQVVPPEAVLDRSEQFRQRGRSIGPAPILGQPIPAQPIPGQSVPELGQPQPIIPPGGQLPPPTPLPPGANNQVPALP